MRYHAVLSKKLSYESEEAAKEAIIPMVYSESLQDAVINLSMNINKLLIPMLKEHIISTGDYTAG